MRASWRGFLRIGEIAMPVRLYGATRSVSPHFVQLHAKDYAPIQRVTICMKDGEELSDNDIVRAVEHEGKYIEISEQDIERQTDFPRDIIIRQITDRDAIDHIYFDKPYYMTPDRGGEMVYAVLRRAFEKTGKVAIATFLFYGRERLMMLSENDGLFYAQTLRFHEEIVPKSEVKVPALTQPSPAQIAVASRLLEHYSLPFHASDYRNQQADVLNQLIDRKAKGLPPKSAPRASIGATPDNEIMKKIEEMLEESPRALQA